MEIMESLTSLFASIEPNRDLLIFCAVAISLIFLVFVFDLLTSFFRYVARAKRTIKEDGPLLEEIQEQLGVISGHASIYANSLGAEGAKLLYKLNALVKEQTETLEFLQLCVDEYYINDLKNYFKDEEKNEEECEWSIQAQIIIELLGKRLYDVSERSSQMGLPKAQRREDTIQSLIRSKIIK